MSSYGAVVSNEGEMDITIKDILIKCNKHSNCEVSIACPTEGFAQIMYINLIKKMARRKNRGNLHINLKFFPISTNK